MRGLKRREDSQSPPILQTSFHSASVTLEAVKKEVEAKGRKAHQLNIVLPG